MLFNCGVEVASWESLGLQGDPTNQSEWKSVLNIQWKDWCWSWNSSALTTWCEELTHLKRPWCWERLKVGGEGDDRGWDGWTASPTQWTWIWADWELVMEKEACCAAAHGVAKSRTKLSYNWKVMSHTHLMPWFLWEETISFPAQRYQAWPCDSLWPAEWVEVTQAGPEQTFSEALWGSAIVLFFLSWEWQVSDVLLYLVLRIKKTMEAGHDLSHEWEINLSHWDFSAVVLVLLFPNTTYHNWQMCRG